MLEHRQRFGLQTVFMTGTVPAQIVRLIAKELEMPFLIDGDGELEDDEALQEREANRVVRASTLPLKRARGHDSLDWSPLDELLSQKGSRIYFANTVERLQSAYGRLISLGVDPESIVVLHNRMPRSWRTRAERLAMERFGNPTHERDWLLLTNQVAEAGLNLSAPLVVSDPAPADTLLQRAGRCARWFRRGITSGEFVVLDFPRGALADRKSGLAAPYRIHLVEAALDSMPSGRLTWESERRWLAQAWAGGKPGEPEKAAERALNKAFNAMPFALNLFDRAAQRHRPGEIADVFRDIVSVEVAIEPAGSTRDLTVLLQAGYRPETSSVSLRQGWARLREANQSARVLRYEEGDLSAKPADYLQTGDVLILPSSVAYLDEKTGLRFGDGKAFSGAILQSSWNRDTRELPVVATESGHQQGLLEHVRSVMQRTYRRLSTPGTYRNTLVSVLHRIEPQKNSDDLADAIAQMARLAAGFHDLGKAGFRWQARARELDPTWEGGLIGRTAAPGGQPIGIPHTPPGYRGCLKAFELLMGEFGPATHLARSIALAAARHHSSLLNPSNSSVAAYFQPHPLAVEFVESVLREAEAPPDVIARADEILAAATEPAQPDEVPLMLPTDDLFPVYALVGRAILMSDREDASNGELSEDWAL
jgi:CRISPR-associated endonuclease/helicase Cas3